jgi:glucokinase
MILAGDVGGTKTALALFEASGSQLHCVREATLASTDHHSLEEMLLAFLRDERSSTSLPRVACLGVAGPVIDGKCHITNLGWQFDEAGLARAVGVSRVKLLNDLEATAYGMLHLLPAERVVLNPGMARKGNIAVVAAGTGLGEAMLFWDGAAYHPIASEGGHADFAPRTDQEIELLRYLRRAQVGHVSYERVLSGPGIHNLYQFLRTSRGTAEPAWLSQQISAGDPSAVIAEVGLARKEETCVAALDLFATLYGAEAGNCALRCLAVGGVFVGGGIAPKLLDVLRSGGFMRGFRDKGRFAELLDKIPVSVSLNPDTALLGAAHYGVRL